MKFRTTNFSDNYAKVHRGSYPDGSTKLTVTGRYDQVLCDATVCLADQGETPADGCVFIRDYGDTEGALHALQNAGVVGRSNRVIQTSTHTRDPLLRRAVHECRLLTTDV